MKKKIIALITCLLLALTMFPQICFAGEVHSSAAAMAHPTSLKIQQVSEASGQGKVRVTLEYELTSTLSTFMVMGSETEIMFSTTTQNEGNMFYRPEGVPKMLPRGTTGINQCEITSSSKVVKLHFDMEIGTDGQSTHNILRGAEGDSDRYLDYFLPGDSISIMMQGKSGSSQLFVADSVFAFPVKNYADYATPVDITLQDPDTCAHEDTQCVSAAGGERHQIYCNNCASNLGFEPCTFVCNYESDKSHTFTCTECGGRRGFFSHNGPYIVKDAQKHAKVCNDCEHEFDLEDHAFMFAAVKSTLNGVTDYHGKIKRTCIECGFVTIVDCAHAGSRRYAKVEEGKHGVICDECKAQLSVENCTYNNFTCDSSHHTATCMVCGLSSRVPHEFGPMDFGTLGTAFYGDPVKRFTYCTIPASHFCNVCDYTARTDVTYDSFGYLSKYGKDYTEELNSFVNTGVFYVDGNPVKEAMQASIPEIAFKNTGFRTIDFIYLDGKKQELTQTRCYTNSGVPLNMTAVNGSQAYYAANVPEFRIRMLSQALTIGEHHITFCGTDKNGVKMFNSVSFEFDGMAFKELRAHGTIKSEEGDNIVMKLKKNYFEYSDDANEIDVVYTQSGVKVNRDYPINIYRVTNKSTSKVNELTIAGNYLIEAETGEGNLYAKAVVKDNVHKDLSKATVTLSKFSYTYNKKVQKPAVTIKYNNSTVPASEYTVVYSNSKSKNAGSYKVTIKGKNSCKGIKSASYSIKRAKNPMKVVGKTCKVKANKKTTILKKKAFKFSKAAAGTVSFTKVKATKSGKNFSKYFTVSKAGKITVKKGLKKGKYLLKVKIKAKGNKNYKAITKNATVKVVVK